MNNQLRQPRGNEKREEQTRCGRVATELGHAAVQANADVAQVRGATSLAALFAGHVLQDGEIILLILKPSLWFIVLSGLRFIAVVLIVMIAGLLFGQHISRRTIQELGLFIIAGRLMWSLLQWMGRVYVLTDLRILRLSGVFSVDIYDCPLRKISRTRIIHSMRERISRTGTIEINSAIDSCPTGFWNTISRPIEVHDQIVGAINRAKTGSLK